LGGVPTDDFFLKKAVLSSPAGSAYFGNDVDVDGNTAAVGAPYASGSGQVFIYTRANSNWTSSWTLAATITGGSANDDFGMSVSLDGDTLVVGAPRVTVGSATLQGKVYVFEKPNGGWANANVGNAVASFSNPAADIGNYSRFGEDVGLSGDFMVVGSPAGTNFGVGAGYIFKKTAGTWDSNPVYSKYGGNTNDYIGTTVAINGNIALIGSPDADANSAVDAGVVYVIKYDTIATTWAQDNQLSGNGNGYRIASALAVEASGRILLGAEGFSSNSGGVATWNCAAACVSVQDFLNPTPAANARFGGSISTDGTTYVVAADGAGTSGKIYLYNFSGGFNLFRTLEPDNAVTGVGFGTSVGVSGNTVMAGMYANLNPFHGRVNESVSAGAADGVVYVFQDYTTTAAGVVVSGRVRTSNGAGLKNAKVTLTDSQGTTRTASTGSFGAFRFENIPVGQDYVLTVGSKRYRFSPQTISLTADLTGLQISANN
jgi:hypothetical protein